MERIIDKINKDTNTNSISIGIIISNNHNKDILIKELSKKLKKISYKSFQEFANDILGENAIDALVDNVNYYNKTNSDIDIIKLKVDNARLIDQEQEDPLLKELYDINARTFKVNEKIINYYNKNKIYLINYHYDNDLVNKSLSLIKSEIVNLSVTPNRSKLKFSEFSSAYDEVFYAVNEIYSLLASGVNADDIIIHTPSKDYLVLFKEAFNLYQIDYLVERPSLLSYEYTKKIVKKIFDKSGDFGQCLGEVYKEQISLNLNSTLLDILNQIIQTINELVKYDFQTQDQHLQDLVISLLKNKKYQPEEYSNIIRFEKVFENIYDQNKHIFILNFNQDVIPSVHKNNTYIKDEHRSKLNLLTSLQKNKIEKQKIMLFLNSNKNLHLSLNENMVRSSLIVELDATVEKKNFEAKRVLKEKVGYLKYIKALDLYNKYSEVNDDLLSLNDYFKYKRDDDIRNINNHINEELLERYINNTVLSYSSISTYYSCPFKFYAKYILKLKKPSDDYKSNTSLLVGNIFHGVLEMALKSEAVVTIEEIKRCTNEYLKTLDIEITPKLKFYIQKLSEDILKSYKIIKSYEENSDFKIHSLEKSFSVVIDGVQFTGKIDKILYNTNCNYYYYVIIDYKTNKGKVDLLDIDKGVDLQLPIYMYLIKTMDENGIIAGAYLQSVLEKSLSHYEEGKSFDEIFKVGRRYHGYTLANSEVINAIDYNCDNDNRALDRKPFKSDGEMSSLFLDKAFSEQDFERISSLAYQKIKEAIEKIKNSKFEVSPMKIENKYHSCIYCNLKDICFKKNTDLREYFSNKDFSFLIPGGEEDGH